MIRLTRLTATMREYYHIYHQNNERIKLPTALAELLEDPNMLKVGCNNLNDRTKLIDDYDLDCLRKLTSISQL